ncbi:hypothetical protein [Streptomyces sp. NPDC020742]|uniref:hypothetical protein n=1 Tax=Streptomyces sp. NPDC020742 TaxID=3154897 RepID=UPI0033F7BBE4
MRQHRTLLAGRRVALQPGDGPVERQARQARDVLPDGGQVRSGRTPSVTGRDARAALTVALAAIRSVTTGGPVRLDALREG